MYITNQILQSRIKRTRGKRLKNNYTKISIVLFVGIGKKSTTEIREYLKIVHQIAEPHGVKQHLNYLYGEEILDKITQIGIGTCYFWKKEKESFRKIINMISNNSEMVRKILRQKLAAKKIRNRPVKLYEINLLRRIKDETTPFDTTEFWYNTNYTESFITNSTLKYFLDQACQRCIIDPVFVEYFESKKMKASKKMFDIILLENYDYQTLLTLMRYSPSLVLYLVNLDVKYKERITNMDERKDLIFQMVLRDYLDGNNPIGGGFYPIPSIEKRFDGNGEFEGVDVKTSISFYVKGKESLKFKGRKITLEDDI